MRRDFPAEIYDLYLKTSSSLVTDFSERFFLSYEVQVLIAELILAIVCPEPH